MITKQLSASRFCQRDFALLRKRHHSAQKHELFLKAEHPCFSCSGSSNPLSRVPLVDESGRSVWDGADRISQYGKPDKCGESLDVGSFGEFDHEISAATEGRKCSLEISPGNEIQYSRRREELMNTRKK